MQFSHEPVSDRVHDFPSRLSLFNPDSLDDPWTQGGKSEYDI